MKTKIFHGDLQLDDLASALANIFNRGNLRTSLSQNENKAFVQIFTQPYPNSGGTTSLGISLNQIDDRIEVQVGEQSLFGVAASLGKSVFLALRDPLNLLGRLDDIAQDIEHLELDDQVWEVLDQLAANADASHHLTDRLTRLTCEYCRVANLVGEGRCIACGAPLGDAQPFNTERETRLHTWEGETHILRHTRRH